MLNADQHFGHLRFSSQILALQSLPRSTDLAAVGSGCPVSGAGRDNLRDSSLPATAAHRKGYSLSVELCFATVVRYFAAVDHDRAFDWTTKFATVIAGVDLRHVKAGASLDGAASQARELIGGRFSPDQVFSTDSRFHI